MNRCYLVVQGVRGTGVTEQWDYSEECSSGGGSGVLLCACLWPLLWGLGSGCWAQKAPALMTEWSAARGAGRLSKRGHSFCLRSLAGPIQPPTPLQQPLPAHFPLRKRGGGGIHPFPLVFLSSESERPYRTISGTQGITTGFKETTSCLDFFHICCKFISWKK